MDPFTLGAGFGFGALLVGIIFAVICRTLADEKGRSDERPFSSARVRQMTAKMMPTRSAPNPNPAPRVNGSMNAPSSQLLM
ncbi:hypothetical protein [Brevibacterium sp. UCMA 11752]|uniref:hypothetical protein n=1 Tax=Brevibacterium sp. UCMA 11752 TaxID=2745946 RepID=UPI001F4172F1|nr:hypothetical protein [Brevibacterium sp. UCMA 11752]MCF2585682.1 hypothetical protein [Brevibacterium sp. UCMA 11752]